MRISVVVLLVLSIGVWLQIESCSGESHQYGDAKIVEKRNLMKTMTFSLNSPEFSLGEEGEVAFDFKGLPSPGLPSSLIVPSPGYAEERPGYLSCKLRVSFETVEGEIFYSKELNLDVLQRSSTGYWPASIRIYEPTKGPEPRSTFIVRITILKKSKNPRDKASLHSFSFDQQSLY